jgi:hypothetical protein
MTDDRFEEFLRETADGYNRPNEVPRDQMWAAIEEARRAGRPVRRIGRPVWVLWGTGIAAALVMGIAIGRFWGGPGAAPLAEGTVAPSEAGDGAYRWAAAEHLGQVETFLTGFQIDARLGRPVSSTGESASDLLSMTRLLLDAPSSDDVQLRALLEDVELVLAQIATYTDRAPSSELNLIDESIEQRSVLFRLRTAMSAGPGGTALQGAL